MTTTFSQTARDVVAGALHDLGVVGLVDVPTAEELRYGIVKLNLILKALAAEGASPWDEEDSAVEFAAGAAEALLKPTPAEVSSASIAVSTGFYRALNRWSAGEYDALPNKAQRGTPVMYELRNRPGGMAMRLWPVPDKTTQVLYSYRRVLEDADENTALDLPQMWSDAIRKMLKAQLTAFMPEGLPQNVLVEAEIARQQLLDYARPEQYVLGPQY